MSQVNEARFRLSHRGCNCDCRPLFQVCKCQYNPICACGARAGCIVSTCISVAMFPTVRLKCGDPAAAASVLLLFSKSLSSRFCLRCFHPFWLPPGEGQVQSRTSEMQLVCLLCSARFDSALLHALSICTLCCVVGAVLPFSVCPQRPVTGTVGLMRHCRLLVSVLASSWKR